MLIYQTEGEKWNYFETLICAFQSLLQQIHIAWVVFFTDLREKKIGYRKFILSISSQEGATSWSMSIFLFTDAALEFHSWSICPTKISLFFLGPIQRYSQLKQPPLGITRDSTMTLVTQQTAIFQKPWLSRMLAFNKASCLATTKDLARS